MLNLIRLSAIKTDHFREKRIQITTKVDAFICSEILEKFLFAQFNVSQYLKVPKIKENIEGNSIRFCLNEKPFDVLKEYFSKIIFILTNKNCC